MNWIVFLLIILWIYILSVLKRAKLNFWYYVVGSAGLFIVSIIVFQPILLVPLQKAVAAVAGVAGELTGTYTGYSDKRLLFVANISLYIDLECSGIIEIFAFLALLWFFPVYRFYEKIVVSIFGVLGIFMSNVLRVFVICQMLFWGGEDMFFWAHSIVGRMIFYICTIGLYFYIFTKPQVVRQKVGAFSYDVTE